jgi:hypothetical protein
MRAACSDPYFKVCVLVEPLPDSILGQRLAPVVQAARHPRSPHRIPSDRFRHAAHIVFHAAVHQRKVRLLDFASRKLRRQRTMGRVHASDQQYATGVLVQAMHYSRPQIATHLR